MKSSSLEFTVKQGHDSIKPCPQIFLQILYRIDLKKKKKRRNTRSKKVNLGNYVNSPVTR